MVLLKNDKRLLKFKFILICLMLSSNPIMSQINMMTYNIRFATETDGENRWSARKDFLTKQIKFHQPDIFGVQEALLPQLKYIEENMPAYKFVGRGRDDGRTKGEFSAIFYDTRKFHLIKEDTFWLSETPEKPSVGWDAAMERVCTYAFFKNIDTKEEFWIFNTHFDHIGVVARKKSTELILQKISELNSKNDPVVLMGDLNLEPETESIKFLSAEMHDSKTISDLVFGPEGTFNDFDFCKTVNRRIDYIFTSKGNQKVLKYGVLSDSKEQKYPSDHFPVLVTIELE